VCLLPTIFHSLHLFFCLLKCFTDRFDQVLHGFFAFFQFALGLDVKLPETFLREPQELFVIAVERLVGHGVEGVLELQVELLKGDLFFGGELAFMLQFGFQLRAVMA